MNTNIFIAKTLWKKQTGKKGLTGGSSLIAGISVAVSIMVMFLSIVISDGFKKEIKDKASGFSGEILLHSPGVDITTSIYPVSATPSFLDSLKSMGSVKAVQPYVYRSAIIKKEDAIQGVLIKGVDSTFDWSFFGGALHEGRLPCITTNEGEPEILMSKRLSEMLGFAVGDGILVYFVDNSVKVRRFLLTGIYNAQLEDIDKTLLLTDAGSLQKVNGWSKDDVSGLEIRLWNGNEIRKSALEIERLTLNAPQDESYFVTSVDELFPHLFDWLKLLDFNVLIIMLLMISVAGFNMVSGLLILLFEKISMIGLLKALGMRDTSIHKIFLTRAFYLVISGMAVGNLLGFVLAYIQFQFKTIPLDPVNYFVAYVPVYFNWTKLILLNVLSVLMITLLLMIPSFFISRVSPEKTLRVK